MTPPRISFKRAEIIETAFRMVREAGWAGLSARSLAKELKSSTMPLYSALKSMDELKGEIRQQAAHLLFDYQRRDHTGEPLLDGAIGYVLFAKEEPHLFRFLFLEQDQYADATGTWRDGTLRLPWDSETEVRKLLPQLPDQLIRWIIQQGWVYTHGLAMMVNSGIVPYEANEIRELLVAHGAAQGMYAMHRHQQDAGSDDTLRKEAEAQGV